MADKKLKSFEEINKFEDEMNSWLNKYYTPIREGFANMAVTEEDNLETQQIEDLKLIIKDAIKDSNEKYRINISQHIFDKIVRIFFQNISYFIKKNQIFLREITEIYLISLSELKKDKPDVYSSINEYQQISPRTIDFISNEIANDNNLLEFIDIDFWQNDIFSEILQLENNNKLIYSLRSMILFMMLIKNRQKRLNDLKK